VPFFYLLGFPWTVERQQELEREQQEYKSMIGY
jgi:hypothetical protein